MKKNTLFIAGILMFTLGFGQTDSIKKIIADRQIANEKKREKPELNCEGVNFKVDKFTGDTTYSTYSHEVCIYKHSNKVTSISLMLKAKGSTVNVNEHGVIILLSDGSKLNYSMTKIGVEASEDGFDYTAIVHLKSEDIEILKTKSIAAFRLYIYDREISLENQKKYLELFNCIANK